MTKQELAGPVDHIPSPIDVNQSLWDQSTFYGRLNRFSRITNPLLLFKTRQDYEDARKLVLQARGGRVPVGTTRQQLVSAKMLYDSAYHPDTGEKMQIVGRMSFQVPGGMIIVGILMTFYQRFIYIVLGQWFNQSFNAVVNYTNRNAKSDVTGKQIAVAYVGATSGAVAAAAGMNLMVERAPAIVRRWVPFVAVVAANCVNIPVMRQRELIDGIVVTDREGKDLAKSKVAARTGISLVLLSRILLIAPSMITIPIMMQRLERRFPVLRTKTPSLVMQTLLTGATLLVSVPVACSLFPQRMSIATNRLEKSVQEEIKSKVTSVPRREFRIQDFKIGKGSHSSELPKLVGKMALPSLLGRTIPLSFHSPALPIPFTGALPFVGKGIRTMLLRPNRMKYRKCHKNIRAVLPRYPDGPVPVPKLCFGNYGIYSLESLRIKASQLESARFSILKSMGRRESTGRREFRIWLRAFPHIPVTKKALGVRMGKGKGAVHHFVAFVRAGKMLFEFNCISENVARIAFTQVAHKMPVKVKFVMKDPDKI